MKTINVPMLLWCPECGVRHIDVGEFALRDHHTHACQYCGHCWHDFTDDGRIGVTFAPAAKEGV